MQQYINYQTKFVVVKTVLLWKSVGKKSCWNINSLPHNPKSYQSWESWLKHCGKMRKCWWPAFSPLPTIFSALWWTFFSIWSTFKLSSANTFQLEAVKMLSFKVAFQILGRKFYKNAKNSSLYSQNLFIFIHRTLVVQRHPITREIRDLLWPRSTTTGNTVYFYMSSSFIYTLKIHRRGFKHSVRWRYYGKKLHVCYVLSLITGHSHNTFFFFFISGAKSKYNLRGYVAC